jgi:hypothetical protein
MSKAKSSKVQIVPEEAIIRKIYLLRGKKVLLNEDLAALYDVETKQLKRQVKRNIERFPEDFMFELTQEEYQSLRSQFGTLKRGQHSKYLPYAFTEQGVAMLSGVINSVKAIEMNIAIMRAFVEIKRVVIENKKIADRLQKLQDKLGEHDVRLKEIYNAIENLLNHKVEQEKWADRTRIAYKADY